MKEDSEYPEQPVQPQQYPPPYPYYYPYPPPKKKDDRWIIYLVIVIVVVFLVLPAIMSMVMWWMITETIDDWEPPTPPDPPVGGFSSVDVRSSSEAWAIFSAISGDRDPFAFRIMLANDTDSGMYIFTDDRDGSELSIVSGSNMGTITYIDYADNRQIDVGDELRMTGLGRQSDYNLRLIWDMTGDVIDSIFFHTI